MTLGNWGIVATLLVLLGGFFAGMEILYARARNERGERQPGMEDAGSQNDTSGKHVA